MRPLVSHRITSLIGILAKKVYYIWEVAFPAVIIPMSLNYPGTIAKDLNHKILLKLTKTILKVLGWRTSNLSDII